MSDFCSLDHQGPQIVVGSRGLVGRALFTRLQDAGIDVLGSARRTEGCGRELKIDLAAGFEPKDLPDRVSVCYILAGTTRMAECEMRRDETWGVNVDATLALADEVVNRGAHVVIVSTNLVFDGLSPFARLIDPIAPQNRYAVEKVEVERHLLASGSASVLRITKIAESLGGLVTDWAHGLSSGRAIHPLSDMFCAPLPLSRVVDALVAIGGARKCRAYHLSAHRDLSYSEIAARLAVKLGADAQLVAPTTSDVAGVEFSALPRYTTLDMSGSSDLLGAPADAVSALDVVFSKAQRALVESASDTLAHW